MRSAACRGPHVARLHAARIRALCDAARTHAVCALRSCVLWPDPNATSVGAWLSDKCKLVNFTRAEALCVCTELGLVALNFTGECEPHCASLSVCVRVSACVRASARHAPRAEALIARLGAHCSAAAAAGRLHEDCDPPGTADGA